MLRARTRNRSISQVSSLARRLCVCSGVVLNIDTDDDNDDDVDAGNNHKDFQRARLKNCHLETNNTGIVPVATPSQDLHKSSPSDRIESLAFSYYAAITRHLIGPTSAKIRRGKNFPW